MPPSVKHSRKTKIRLQPLGDRVVIERDDPEEVLAGGIVLPDSAKDAPARGTVIAVGDGILLEDGARAPLQVNVGDRVFFSSYAGDVFTAEDELEPRELLLMREADILAVIEDVVEVEQQELLLPVRVYISDNDVTAATGRRVAEAAIEYLESFGFAKRDIDAWEEHVGSFFKRMFMAIKLVLGNKKVVDALQHVEDGVKNYWVGLPESEKHLNQAESAAKLIASLKTVDNAVVVVGPVILVKRTEDKTQSVFIVPLLRRIQKAMEDNPGCLKSPAHFFEVLEEVQQSAIDSKAWMDRPPVEVRRIPSDEVRS